MSRRGGYGNIAAIDREAIIHDQQIKNLTESVVYWAKDKYPKIGWRSEVTAEEIPHSAKTCRPDGGIYYYKGIPIMAVESKKQNDRGNAGERWATNYGHITSLNPNMTYLTFGMGEGATQKNARGRPGALWKSLSFFHKGECNVDRIGSATCYLKVSGFSNEEIVFHLKRILETTIIHYDKITN